MVVASTATALEPDRAISQYARRAWSTEQGLPNSVVRGVLQTADGYIWMATYEGLARFNGHSFTRFDKKNLPALKRDTVLAFVRSRDGLLWAGTNGGGVGILRMNRGNPEMRVLTMADGLPSDVVNALAEQPDGTMWIGTSAGLCAYRNGRLTPAELTSASVSALAFDRSGALWVGTRGHGLTVLSQRRDVPARHELRTAAILALLPDENGSVWAGTNQGLHRIAASSIEPVSGIPQEQVTTLLRDSDGTLWAGTYSNGLFRIADGKVSQFTKAEGLLNNSVRSLFEDNEKNLWVGSNGGVQSLSRGKFITVGVSEGLADPYVRSVFEDREGNIWIGTSRGLTRFRGTEARTFDTKDGLSNDYALSIAQGGDGAIWIGTPTGLNRLADGRVTVFTEKDGFSPRAVRALHCDRRGVLWIGTDRGAMRYENGRFESVLPAPKWDVTFVNTFAEDAQGGVWLGSDGRGLAHYQNGRFTTWMEAEGLPDTHVLSLLIDARGTLWIGTDSAGLIRMRDGKFTRYTADSGLYGDKVMQILEDSSGRLWFGGSRGIWHVPLRELEELAAGKRTRVTSTPFGSGDGVRSIECNGSAHPAAIRSRDGRLWFSTVDGVATIAPADADVLNPRPPPVLIETVTIDGRSTAMPREVVVPPGAQRLEISYAALTYAPSQNARFRIRLEGFDRQWVDAADRRVAFYTGLPPGQYRFQVQAANADGIWNKTGAELPVTIRPRFVQTIWFPLLVLLALVSMVWLLMQRRVYVMKRREGELVHVVAERTAEIQAALRESEEQEKRLAHALVEAEAANQAKSIFLANVSHELRTPLNAIIGFASVLQRDSSTFNDRQLRFVHNIAVSGEHLLALINDILDLAKIEAGKMTLDLEPVTLRDTFDGVARVLKGITLPRGIELDIDVPRGIDTIAADAIKLKQIIYNLVSNAVKFSPNASVIRIIVRRLAAAESPLGRDAVSIAVADHGIGIAAEHQQVIFEEFRQIHLPATQRPAGTGLGLTLVKKFVELHGGVVLVDSERGRGSTFTVVLPFIDPAALDAGQAVSAS